MPIVRDSTDSDSEMDSLYSEDESDSSDSTADTDKDTAVEPFTELVSKKLLEGKTVKPGDKVILTVVKDFGDEVELKYSTEKAKEPEMSEDDELDSLAV